jgi:GNAT superfamily N-acetyltransferase
VRLVQAEPGPLLDKVFADLLSPAFTADELGTLADLRGAVEAGLSRVVVALDASGTPVGAAVGEWSPATRILLLGYLAVSRESRSGGIGSLLLAHAFDLWRAEFEPRAILAEIEHPAAYPASPERGDPVARLRFYARLGAQALPVPYFQPALGPRRSRVYGMILAALWVSPDGAGKRPDTIAPDPVRAYIREYFRETEGAVPDDPGARALFKALDEPDGVALLPLDEPGRLPVSAPD